MLHVENNSGIHNNLTIIIQIVCVIFEETLTYVHNLLLLLLLYYHCLDIENMMR